MMTMINFNFIKEKLFSLILKIFQKLENESNLKPEQGLNIRIPRMIYIPKFSNLQFINDRVNGTFSYEREIEWNLAIDHQINEKYLKNSFEEYTEIINHLKKETEFTEKFLNFTISIFIHNYINKCIEKIDKDLFFMHFSYLKDYLGKNLVLINVKTYYRGIWLTQEELVINENLKLRRVRAEDFVCSSIEQLNEEVQNFMSFSEVILEFTFKKNYNNNELESNLAEVDLQEELALLDNLLLYIKMGSVSFKKSIINRHYPNFEGGVLLKNTQIPSQRFVVVLGTKNISKLKDLRTILSKDRIREFFSIRKRKFTHIDIALHRYSNSFNFSENLQSFITSGIMCLEALFTENKPQLGRSLRERLSILLKIVGFSALSIESIIKKAYNIRSAYSHGSLYNINTIDLLTIAHQTLELARISILIILQLELVLSDQNKIKDFFSKRILRRLQKNTKQRLIKLLDNALLDALYYKKVQKFIISNCFFV